MGMLSWLLGTGDDEVDDGELTVVADAGRFLVRGNPQPGDSATTRADKRGGVVVSTEAEVEAVRRRWWQG